MAYPIPYSSIQCHCFGFVVSQSVVMEILMLGSFISPMMMEMIFLLLNSIIYLLALYYIAQGSKLLPANVLMHTLLLLA
ncbi:MAG: hypothetical protein ACI8RD_012110 [Bacillariaceae sp.]|jgi:hypothetical protein